jgi:hypothetical protein
MQPGCIDSQREASKAGADQRAPEHMKDHGRPRQQPSAAERLQRDVAVQGDDAEPAASADERDDSKAPDVERAPDHPEQQRTVAPKTER